jgi:hypothetical protein
MRAIAFITDGATVRDIVIHLGELTAPAQTLAAGGRTLNGSLRL